MKARAVIGSLYGDEGKGLTTDFFAHQAMRDFGACTVVRSNGGTQAGHTVETPEGVRHVFHHIGSGTLAGAATHLSQYMICNPIMFNREYDELAALGYQPSVTVSPSAMVTFPQDMLINQMLETIRGGTRHGSCGLGIGETCERFENPAMQARYRFGEISQMGGHRATIRKQFTTDLATRLGDLGLSSDQLPADYRDYLSSPDVWSSFWQDCELMLSRVRIVPDTDLDPRQPIVFEAAQGLALDRDMGFFPYVTRSKTGLMNIARLARGCGIDDLEVINLMRCYTSRHGAGPLDGHTPYMGKYGFVIHDPTNQPNDWQGTLRFAPLDLWLAKRMIDLDFDAARPHLSGIAVTRAVGVTCLDQASATLPVFNTDREKISLRKADLLRHVADAVGATNAYAGSGPTRATYLLEFGEEA